MIRRVYELSRVLDLKEKILRNRNVAAYVDRQVSGTEFEEFTKAIHAMLPKNIPWEVIYDSLLHLAGQTITETALEDNVWRLTGNIARLRLHFAVPPWDRQTVDEMVPVQIVSARRAVSAKRKPGANFDFQVLAGTSCPEVITKFWTKGFCSLLSQRMGFSKPWHKYRFDDCYQFVSLRLYVQIETRLCKAAPDFEAVWEKDEKIHPPACIVWNRRILRLRTRQGFRCPRKFHGNQQCHLCIVGLDECPAATHDATFVKRECDQCRKQSWFDPEEDSSACLDCQYRNLWK